MIGTPTLATESIHRAGINLASEHGYCEEAAIHHAVYVFSVAIERSQIHARVDDSEGARGGRKGVDRGNHAN